MFTYRNNVVVTAPEHISREAQHRMLLFLAGAIDMGQAVEWQAEFIKSLPQLGLVILNPRRETFDETTLDEQIEWELQYLAFANIIAMWLPEHAKAPISLFEAGLFMGSHRLIIGAHPNFYRRRNLELTCPHYGVELHDSLSGLVRVVEERVRLSVET